LVSLLGTGEPVLRSFPLVCGVVSLWFFYRMARIYLNGEFTILALFAFTVTPALVYYSSQVKPYGTDVFFTLLSYVVIAEICFKGLDWDKTIMMAWLGAVIIWFSFPVVFILLGIGLVLILDAWVQRDRAGLLMRGLIFLYWLASFILCYKVLLYNCTQVIETPDFQPWQSGYVSLTGNNNGLNILNGILIYPVGIPYFLSWFAGILFCVGGYSFFRADKRKSLLLLVPLVFVFLASALHKFPCKERLTLFLVPIFLIMIVKGVETFSSKMGRYKIIAVFVIAGALFGCSFFSILQGLMEPATLEANRNEEIRSVISYVKEHRLPGDNLFISYASAPAFEYYAPGYGFSDGSYIEQQASYSSYTKAQSQDWKNNLEELKGSKRVWVIVSHIMSNRINGKHPEELLLEYLSRSGGQLIDRSSSKGACVYLFDLSKFPGEKH